MRQRSIRLRLTLWYGGVFVALGVGLIALNYFLVQEAFPGDRSELREAVAERLGVDQAEFGPRRPVFAPPPAATAGRLELADLLDQTSAQVEDDVLNSILLRSGIALVMVGFLSVGAGWFLAGRQLRPLRDITATARRISDENLHERVALEGPQDELRDLAQQFDVMLDRLQRAFVGQREFVANASHELRTPLTIIRTQLEVTLSEPNPPAHELLEMRTAVLHAIERAELLIDRLLALAQAEAGIEQAERVDLAAVLRDALARHAAQAAERGLRSTVNCAAAPITGDPVLLERLAGNLVENAIRHNEVGGWLSASTGRSGDEAVLRLVNSGAPIPAEAIDGLFDRFVRVDGSRNRATGGFGLGLSIVRTVAEVHGGRVEARPRAEGGLDITIRLPAAPPRT